MNLKGRNLSLDMDGPDVDLLLLELRALEFKIPEGETQFGEAPRKAVVNIQRQEGPEPTGIVDGATAAAINRRFAQIPPTGRIGGVAWNDSGGPIAGAHVDAVESGIGSVTGVEGKYELQPLPYGTLPLVTSSQGYQLAEVLTAVETGRPGVQNFILNLAPGEQRASRGRVLHRDGSPFVHEKVRGFYRWPFTVRTMRRTRETRAITISVGVLAHDWSANSGWSVGYGRRDGKHGMGDWEHMDMVMQSYHDKSISHSQRDIAEWLQRPNSP